MQWGRLPEVSSAKPGGHMALMPAPLKPATPFISLWYPKGEVNRGAAQKCSKLISLFISFLKKASFANFFSPA